jgi:hypothetical protein
MVVTCEVDRSYTPRAHLGRYSIIPAATVFDPSEARTDQKEGRRGQKRKREKKERGRGKSRRRIQIDLKNKRNNHRNVKTIAIECNECFIL